MSRVATININIEQHERDTVLKAIKKLKGETISVAKLAKSVGYNSHRTRYIIEDLLQRKLIKKIPTKFFNERYVRYTYEVIS